MQIKVIYKDKTFVSQNVEMSNQEVSLYAESLYESLDKMKKFKIHTSTGWIVFPESILKESIILVEDNC